MKLHVTIDEQPFGDPVVAAAVWSESDARQVFERAHEAVCVVLAVLQHENRVPHVVRRHFHLSVEICNNFTFSFYITSTFAHVVFALQFKS